MVMDQLLVAGKAAGSFSLADLRELSFSVYTELVDALRREDKDDG